MTTGSAGSTSPAPFSSRRRGSHGWVEKQQCPTDARVTYAALTEAGHAKIAAARESHAADIEELFGGRFTPEEAATLDELLSRLPLADTACQS